MRWRAMEVREYLAAGASKTTANHQIPVPRSCGGCMISAFRALYSGVCMRPSSFIAFAWVKHCIVPGK